MFLLQDRMTFIRVLARRLWQKYDSAGHSLARSMQARLLEAVIFGWHMDDLPVLDLNIDQFISMRATPVSDERDLFIETILERISWETYLSLVFFEIQKMQRMPHDSYFEKELVETILYLLNAERRIEWHRNAGGHFFSPQELIAEGERRRDGRRSPEFFG
jgi:hypothetical protein